MKLLIAIDLDNTLLSPNGKIPNSFFEILKKTGSDIGFKIVIASGRHLNNIVSLLGKNITDCDIIAENGATIVHNNEIIQNEFISAINAKHILSNYSEQFSGVMIYYAKNLVLIKSTTELCSYLKNNNVKFEIKNELLNYNNIKKISFFSQSPLSNIPNFKLPSNIKAEISTPYLIDFIDTNYSKGKSLSILQSLLGYNYWNTVTFGDSQTDIGMFNNSFFSFAMDNANDEVKSYAHFIAPPCSEDGVSSVLKVLKYNIDPICKLLTNCTLKSPDNH